MRKVFAQKPAVPGSQERATRSACRALRGTSRGRLPRSPWHLAMLQCCRRAPELDRKPRLCACRSRARHFDSRIDIAAMPEVLFDPALIVMAWSEGQSVLREAITRRPNPDPHKPRGRNSISLAFVLKRGKKRAGLGSAEGDFVRRHRLHQRAPRGHKLGGRGARRLPSHRGRGGGPLLELTTTSENRHADTFEGDPVAVPGRGRSPGEVTTARMRGPTPTRILHRH